MTTQTIRDDVYAAMLAAVTTTGGYLTRGRDGQDGPTAGLGTLLMLERRGWARLERIRITRRGRVHQDVAGGWLLPYGRTRLRDEIGRRGDQVPAHLGGPARTPVAAGR